MSANIKIQEIFGITNEREFEKIALEVYEYQKKSNPVYKEYLSKSNRIDKKVTSIQEIPFLPISFFKSHQVICTDQIPEIAFSSTGTVGIQSFHLVSDVHIYEEAYLKGFAHFYGAIEDYALLALLPSYLEREGSSLIYMVDDLIQKTNSEHSGFYLDNYEDLTKSLHEAFNSKKKIILLGVSFALLDLAEKMSLDLKDAIVMETGGMKGKRAEITRAELHEEFKKAFHIEKIHSEYGMTELLSQAYSKGDGIFKCPPWMQVLFRDPYDPFTINELSGGINVIDLANIHSCAFIETSDLGRKTFDGFEVLGRLDNSDIRGCNLMIQ